jgi:hypothetical protein
MALELLFFNVYPYNSLFLIFLNIFVEVVVRYLLYHKRFLEPSTKTEGHHRLPITRMAMLDELDISDGITTVPDERSWLLAI